MTLKDEWLNGIVRAGRRARLVRLYLYISFTLPVVVALYNLSQMQATRSSYDYGSFGRGATSEKGPATIFNLTGTLIILTAVIILTRKNLRVARSAADLETLPLTADFQHLQLTITTLAEGMGISPESFSILLDVRDFGISPCVARLRTTEANSQLQITAKPSIALVLPVGFLKLLVEEPETSKAVLAHELAHIKQEDWQLWGLSSAYTEALRNFALPIALVFCLISLVDIVRLTKVREQLEEKAYNLKDYAEILNYSASARAELRAVVPSDLFADPQSQIQEARFQTLLGFGTAAQAFIAPLIQFLVLRIILRMRGRSERLADLAAVVYVGAPAIMRALQCCGSKEPRWKLLSAHPPIKERLTAVAKGAVVGAPKEPTAVETAFVQSARKFRSGPTLATILGIQCRPYQIRRAFGFVLSWIVAGALGQVLIDVDWGLPVNARDFMGLLGDAAFLIVLVISLMLWKRMWIAVVIAGFAQAGCISWLFFQGTADFNFAGILRLVMSVGRDSVGFLVVYSIARRRLSLGSALIAAGVFSFSLFLVIIELRSGFTIESMNSVRGTLCDIALRVLCIYLWAGVFSTWSNGANSKPRVKGMSSGLCQNA